MPVSAEAECLVCWKDIPARTKVWDPDPTRAAAEQQIRLQAAGLGGNAIIAARYETRGVTVQPNCWSSITAYGTAIRIAE